MYGGFHDQMIDPIPANRHPDYRRRLDVKYACPYCDFPNKRKDHIYRHIRRKHPGNLVGYMENNQPGITLKR